MTERATGRHRAPVRATTPLTSFGTSLTSSVSDHVTGISRSGAILAVSSGLVATMGLPAGAVARGTPNADVIPLTAPLSDVASDPTRGAVPLALTSGDPVTAPASATLTFDRSALTVAPKPKPRPKPAAPVSRSATRTSLDRSTAGTSTRSVTGGSSASARGSSVIAVASRYIGVPYRYGGTTPSGFDCSGYTQYVYAQLGVTIPRTADQQYDAATRVPSSQARPGDLVFFLGSGGAYHVAVFAGDGMIYDAGKPGRTVTKREIWSADIAFGRF